MVGAVLGIIDYTRWPGPLRPIVLCVLGDGPLAADLVAAAAGVMAPRPLMPRQLPPPLHPTLDCDVVFFVGSTPTERAELLLSMATRPVLTVGISQAFCSIGGQFCLQPGPAGVRFSVNTDAVSRSGLQVNPRVLLLGRARPPEAPR